jgi:hypothetical protein
MFRGPSKAVVDVDAREMSSRPGRTWFERLRFEACAVYEPAHARSFPLGEDEPVDPEGCHVEMADARGTCDWNVGGMCSVYGGWVGKRPALRRKRRRPRPRRHLQRRRLLWPLRRAGASSWPHSTVSRCRASGCQGQYALRYRPSEGRRGLGGSVAAALLRRLAVSAAGSCRVGEDSSVRAIALLMNGYERIAQAPEITTSSRSFTLT